MSQMARRSGNHLSVRWLIWTTKPGSSEMKMLCLNSTVFWISALLTENPSSYWEPIRWEAGNKQFHLSMMPFCPQLINKSIPSLCCIQTNTAIKPLSPLQRSEYYKPSVLRRKPLPADRYTATNCSWPRMFTMLEEKLHKTYMLAAMWNKEKWLNVDSNIGEQRTSAREERKW